MCGGVEPRARGGGGTRAPGYRRLPELATAQGGIGKSNFLKNKTELKRLTHGPTVSVCHQARVVNYPVT